MLAAFGFRIVPTGQEYSRHVGTVVVDVVVLVVVVVSVLVEVTSVVVASVVVLSVVVGTSQQSSMLCPTMPVAFGLRVPDRHLKVAQVRSQQGSSEEITAAFCFKTLEAGHVKLLHGGTQQALLLAPTTSFAVCFANHPFGQVYIPLVTSQQALDVVPAMLYGAGFSSSPIGHWKTLHAISQQLSSCGMLSAFSLSIVSTGQL